MLSPAQPASPLFTQLLQQILPKSFYDFVVELEAEFETGIDTGAKGTWVYDASLEAYVFLHDEDDELEAVLPASPQKESSPHDLLAGVSHHKKLMLKRLICGGAAGFVSRTMTAPLDRMRVIIMTSQTSKMSLAASCKECMYGRGMKGFWVGNGINCLKVTPETAIKLFVFDTVRDLLCADAHQTTVMERFSAGALAGAISHAITYPIETVRTRLTVARPGVYNGIRDCFTKTSKLGWKMFFAGVTPSVAGIMPFAAIDLTVNSMCRERVEKLKRRGGQWETYALPLDLSCGMVSSASAAFVTFPTYVIRTNLQAYGGDVRSTVAKLVKKDGMRGLYRGLIPNFLKIVPATGISYAVYDYLARQF